MKTIGPESTTWYCELVSNHLYQTTYGQIFHDFFSPFFRNFRRTLTNSRMHFSRLRKKRGRVTKAGNNCQLPVTAGWENDGERLRDSAN